MNGKMGVVGPATDVQASGLRSSVRVFGGVGIDDGDAAVGMGGARQRRLLALLVARHGHVVTIDWLAENLWVDDERPDAFATRLRTYMSRLRHSLPADASEWIETESGGYRFAAPPEAIEHVRFLSLRAAARDARDRGDPCSAGDLLDDALGLWRGDPFRELEDLDWARAEIEHLHIDRLEMLEERWEAELALGRHTQIIGDLGSFVVEQPLRERAVRQYALALHRSGRTAEALRVIATFRRELTDQTGLDPSPDLAEFEQSLLDGDPALSPQPGGRPLRGYRLHEEVGAGAFAIVWRATQPSVQRDVAIKQIRSNLASRPEFIRRFEAEAQLVARIEHPHIVPLIDYWREPDSAYLVMRWLGGDTLERRLAKGALSVNDTLKLADEIGGALSASHAHGVIHRDVKPSNILFDLAGNAYLTDFGIALEAADADRDRLSAGSPAYASPDQLRGDPVGPEADVFSLGMVLYECLSGWAPLGTAGTTAALVDHEHDDGFPPLAEMVEGIPTPMSAAIARAIARDPTERFGTVASFVDGLRPRMRGGPTPLVEVGPVENPYLGLRAFDDGDAERFFGRERLVSEIADRFAGDGVQARCVVVVGPSGSGKSSVVRAGVVPVLRNGAVPGSADWFTTTMVPGADPYEALEAALLRIAVNPPTSLLDQLRDGERGILRGVRRCLPGDDHRVAIVIDQFEELFTRTPSADADRFLDALSVAVDDPISPLRLVGTIRADYYDRPLQHPTFARIVKEAAVEVTPLTPDELVAAITEPAHRVGIEFEAGLVARIASETVGQPSPLPLLQFTLSELFERRRSGATLTTVDYAAIGGLTGALATRAEALFDEADTRQQATIRSVFGRLTNPGESTVDTRRRVPIADLGTDDSTNWVLDGFGGARLLTFDRDTASREPTVEVAHEALLREWPRAAVWLDEDRELRRKVDAIGAAATIWERGDRQETDLYRGNRLDAALDVRETNPDWLRPIDHEFVEASDGRARSDLHVEQRRVQRLRRLVAGTAAGLVLALVAGGLALVQQRRADDEARAAEQEAARAEGATAAAELVSLSATAMGLADDQPDAAFLLALEARQRSPGPDTDRALLDTIAAAELGRQTALRSRLPVTEPCGRVEGRTLTPDGLSEFAAIDGTLLLQDLTTGATADRGEAPASCVRWFEDANTGFRWAGSTTDIYDQSIGTADGGWAEVQVDESVWWPDRSSETGGVPPGALLHPEGIGDRWLYWTAVAFAIEAQQIVVVDAGTLEPVGPALDDFAIDSSGGSLVTATAASTEDGLFAIVGESTATDAAAPGGLMVLLDARTGEEVLRVRRSRPLTSVVFDPDRHRVLAGEAGGDVIVLDLETGESIEQLTTDALDAVIALGVRPDGTIVAVGRQWIETFDPGEEVGQAFATVPSDEARVRPDGTVVLVPTGDSDRFHVLDPIGGLLVEQGVDVDPAAVVGIGAGHAGVLGESGEAEIIELTTGERQDVDLTLPGGDPFAALGFVPEVDGHLAWDDGTNVVRWRDGRVVERLPLWPGPGTVSLTAEDGATRRLTGLHSIRDGATVVFQRDVPRGVYAFDTGAATSLTPSATIESPPTAAAGAAPARDGGIHVVLDDGRLRSYDATGHWTVEVPTGLRNASLVVTDPQTGSVAIGGENGAVLVDPATGSVQHVRNGGSAVALEFARDGALLVVVELDGSVGLWDTVRAESAGTLWQSSDGASRSRPWYDPSTDSVWVAASGSIMRFSLDPQDWVDHVCAFVGRELTVDEWNRLVPGDAPQRPACS